MLSIAAQLEKQKLLSDRETLIEKTKGHIKPEFLDKLIELGISPFRKDGTLKTRNCLSVMVWRYTNKDKWYKTKAMMKARAEQN